MTKIEKLLLNKITSLSNEKFLDVVIYFNDYEKIKNLLKTYNINNQYYEFINAIGARLNTRQIFSLSSHKVVEYITSASKVEALMDIAKKTINIEKLHCQNILGQNKTLAIIDTGIASHLDFLSFKNRIIYFYDFVNKKTNFYDDNGHGTFVSGVAAGNGFLSAGKYTGIAPMANIIMLKALDKRGEASAFNILDSMEWIYNYGKEYNIDAVCMSFGSNPLDRNDPLAMGANALYNKGITVIAAAGNSGPEPRTIKSPGVSNKIITVGGVDDRQEQISVPDFSSRGPAYSIYKPDLLAPSVEIVSTNFENVENIPYTTMSGTSVATPIVAGTVLLLKQINKDLTPLQIKRLLLKNTITLPQNIGGGRNKQGFGFLNLKNLF